MREAGVPGGRRRRQDLWEVALGSDPYTYPEEVTPMFKELTEELLDLTVVEKGYRNALYAANDAGGGGPRCSSSTSTCELCISLCCSWGDD